MKKILLNAPSFLAGVPPHTRGRWDRHFFFRIMRITAAQILLISVTMGVSIAGDGFSQEILNRKVSLELTSSTLKDALAALETQAKVKFVYSASALELTEHITLIVSDEKLSDVLDNLLEPRSIKYVVKNKIHIVLKPAKDKEGKAALENAENRDMQGDLVEVAGNVTDASSGEPLPGVNVIIKGSTQGTVTDGQGTYSVEVPSAESILVFSFVGYESKEVLVGGRSVIDVVLNSDVTSLEEVVVVGYGSQKRENLTGAIAQINAEDIALRPSPNIITALYGLMPGLTVKLNSGDPRNTPEINIRGFNSINGGSPLILVDGIEGQLELINPTDIESITVLKDAASSAIYGARGAFGVILVTTKKGAVGDIRVDYMNNFGLTTQTNRTDYISDPYVHGKTVDAGIFGYNGSSFTGYDDSDWETLQKVISGEIAPFHQTLANGTNKFFYNTNWYDYMFAEWRPSEIHNISLSGGTERLKGYFSGRYYKTDDINNIAPGNLIKYNLKGTLNFQVTDWLEVSGNIQYNTHDEIEYGGTNNGWRDINSASTWLGLYSWQPNFIDGIPFHGAGTGTFAAMEAKKSWRTRYVEQFINTINVALNPVKGFELNFNYSNRINHRDVATRLNQFDLLGGSRILPATEGLNTLSESREKASYSAMNLYGTYRHSIDNNHNFKLMVGYNQEDYVDDYIVGTHGDLLYPDLSNFSLGTSIIDLTGSASNWAVQGYFGRFNYDYKNRYLLEINARKDGSSRFPDYSRWGFFPSVSAGWYLSQEQFWTPLENLFTTFKIRGSYGKLGNQNVGLYTFSQTLNNSLTSWLFDGARQNYVGVPAPLPSVVTWEETTTIDLGVDFGFLQNKLQASFDWYEKTTKGMYVSGQPLPAVFGASEPKENIAGLSNKGFELNLAYNNQINVKDHPLNFKATVSIFNYVASITEYPNPEGLMSSYWEGQKLGEIWGYHVDGQFQSDEEAMAYYESFDNPRQTLGQVYYLITGTQNSEWQTLRAGDIKYVDADGDGEISKGNYTLDDHGDLTVIGNAMPQFPFGFSVSADWKGFDVSLAGAGVARQDWVPGGVPYWGHYDRPQASFIRKDLVENAWSPENPDGKYPQVFRGYTALGPNRMLYEPNDFYLENVGYLRVKNLTLGYSLPQSLINKYHVQNLRIYFSGENIFTWRFGGLTKYVDPEQAASGIGYNNPGDATGRSLLEEFPYGKTYSLGISISL